MNNKLTHTRPEAMSFRHVLIVKLLTVAAG